MPRGKILVEVSPEDFFKTLRDVKLAGLKASRGNGRKLNKYAASLAKLGVGQAVKVSHPKCRIMVNRSTGKPTSCRDQQSVRQYGYDHGMKFSITCSGGYMWAFRKA